MPNAVEGVWKEKQHVNIQHQAHPGTAERPAPCPDGNASANTNQAAWKWRRMTRRAREESCSCSLSETTRRAAASWINPLREVFYGSRENLNLVRSQRVLGLQPGSCCLCHLELVDSPLTPLVKWYISRIHLIYCPSQQNTTCCKAGICAPLFNETPQCWEEQLAHNRH